MQEILTTSRWAALSALIFFVGVAAAPEQAHAQPPRIGFAGSVGFGGESTGEADEGSRIAQEETEMDTGIGGFVQFRYIPHPFISVGARPGLYGFRSEEENEAEFGRSMAIHLDAFLQLQYEFGKKDNLIYVLGFIAPTYVIPSGDAREQFTEAGLSLTGGFAPRYGGALGLSLQGGDTDPALFIEGAYMVQRVNYALEGETPNPAGGPAFVINEEASGMFWQFLLNIGLSFSL